MSHSPFTPRGPLSRRRFLRGTGSALLGLPFLEAMTPTFGRSARGDSPDSSPPPRFVAMCAGLGFHAPCFFPGSAGADDERPEYLEALADHADDFTLFSGVSHPNQQGNNGHASELTWLTSAQRPGLAGFRNTISLDQLIANEVGLQTRVPFLALSTSGRSLSWTENGVEIPGETSPERLFQALFVTGDSHQVADEMRQLQRGRSILDTVFGEAQRLERDLAPRDRHKLDEYLTSVRDLESRLQQSQGWVQKPKPEVTVDPPRDVADRNDAIGRQRLMYDMIALALQTDSTRAVTFQLSGLNSVPVIPGVENDWHNLSHHGKDPEKIEELKIIEAAEIAAFNDFLTRLKQIEENGRPLLDQTAVLFGSNLGNASSHDWHNVPIIVAGGRFRHAGHIAGNTDDNTPLANLHVSLAQHMGLEIDQFGSSTAAGITGFDLA